MFTSALLSGCSLLRSVPFLFSHPYTANGLFSPVGSSLFYRDIPSCGLIRFAFMLLDCA